MDIFNELLADHWAIRDLLKGLRSEATGPRQKHELLKQLGTWLSEHANGEAKTIDDYGKRRADLRVLAYEDCEEHSTIDLLYAKLQKTRNTYLWAARLHLVCELLEHHLDEEEEEYIPLLRRSMSAEESRELALRYRSLTKGLDSLRPKGKPGFLGWLSGRPEPSPDAASDSILL
jgi:hemerythrin-like domain-containing protein